MPVAISTATPVLASNNTGTNKTVTTASFTPPGGSLLLVNWACDTATQTDSPPTPSITDNLASHLTYTLVQFATSSSAGANVGGQAAIWTAVAPASPSAMTITVTDNDGTTGFADSGLQVWVLTGANTSSPVGSSGIGKLSPAATAVAQNYTGAGNGGMGFLVGSDWNAAATSITAGSGCSAVSDDHGTVQFNFFIHRTAGDDVAGVSNALSGTLNTADTALWAWADIAPQNYTATLTPGFALSASPAGSAAGAANMPVGLSLTAGSTVEPGVTLAVGFQLPAAPNLWIYQGQVAVTYPQYAGMPGAGALTVTPGSFVFLIGRASGWPYRLPVPPPDGAWVTLGSGGSSYGVPLERERRSLAPARSRPARHGDRSESAYQAAGARRTSRD